MLEKIKSTVSDPKFQRQAALAGGKVVTLVVNIVIGSLVDKAVTAGINAVMDKIQGQTVINPPTE